MDKDRQIRFLIPPFFLVASLLWGAYLSGQLNNDWTPRLAISTLGVIGVSALPVGYAIGVLTIAALRGLWRVLWLCRVVPNKSYELPLSKVAIEKLWGLLDCSLVRQSRLDLCAAAVFDHAQLKPRIHEWLIRRWNAFNISSQCVAAMLLSIPMAHALHIHIFAWALWRWWASIAVLVVVFVYQAYSAWRDTRNMFDFAVEAPTAVRSRTAG
jgi:hypothetical protein